MSDEEKWKVAKQSSLQNSLKENKNETIIIRKEIQKSLYSFHHIEFYNLFMYYKSK